MQYHIMFMADISSAVNAMHVFVTPVMNTLCVVGSLACIFFLVNGGVSYMTSAGKPSSLEHAKRVIRNALIGLVMIFAAATLTQILSHAYGSVGTVSQAGAPSLAALTPAPVSNSLIGVIITAITGVLNDIIQSLALPFVESLAYFTKETPLMASNTTVFNLWLAMVGISDALFVGVVGLVGFHIMSASTFGLNEIDLRHLFPRLALIFLILNTSIFAIDGIIELSNAMIHAINLVGDTTSLWNVLTGIVKQAGVFDLPSLLIMLLFTILSIVLVIYYIGRLVSLYIGAILSPLILLLWLVPGFRDFSEAAAKTYIVTVFVLFVQVVILIVAGSLIASATNSSAQPADNLMSLLTGVAAMFAVLRVPVTTSRLSFASIGPQATRQLSGQFMNGISTITYSSTRNASHSNSLHTTNSSQTDNSNGQQNQNLGHTSSRASMHSSTNAVNPTTASKATTRPETPKVITAKAPKET